MKKKFSVVFLVALMIASLFISCDNGIKNSDPLAKVLFVDSESLSKGLNMSVPSFEASKLFWTYTAKKMDNSGMNTGATNEPKAVNGTGENPGLGSKPVGPFSLGMWQFTLQAREGSISGPVQYEGTVSNQLIQSGSSNIVSVKVRALQDGLGYVVFEEITLKDANGHLADQSNEHIRFAKADDPDTELIDIPHEGRKYTVPAGSYKITVDYTDPFNKDSEGNAIVYGKNSIWITVFANQTVTIGGNLEEITGSAELEMTYDGGLKDVTQKTVGFAEDDTDFIDQKVMNIEAGTSPVITEKPTDPVDKKTTITIPQNAIPDASGTAHLDVTSYAAPVAGKKFQVEANNNVVSALEIDLKIGDQAVKEFQNDVKVVTYIPTGLSNVNVKYFGDGADPTDVKYDPETGRLSFKTNHFSTYCVVSNSEAMNARTNKSYAKLEDAIKDTELKSGDEILLLNDIVNKDYAYANVRKFILPAGVILNGNGHIIEGNCHIDIDKAGGTVKNVVFQYIHNNKFVGLKHNDFIFETEKTGDLSALYASSLNGVAVIENCVFNTFDWEGIQITPSAGAEIYITGNTFKFDSNNNVGIQYPIRNIHVQSGRNIDFKAVITGNVLLDNAALNQTGLEVYFPKDINKCVISGNYIDSPVGVCVYKGGGIEDPTAVLPFSEGPNGQPAFKPVCYTYDRLDNVYFCESFDQAVGLVYDGKKIHLMDNVVASTGWNFPENRIVKNGYTISYRWDGKGVDTAWYTEGPTKFTLSTPAQVAGFSKLVVDGNNFSGKTVELAEDIDLNNKEWTSIGSIRRFNNKPNAVQPKEYKDGNNIFRGTFDGHGHSINNLKIQQSPGDKSAVGFFGIVGDGAVIQNLNIASGTVSNVNDAAAGVVGMTVGNVTINNCENHATITSDVVGNDKWGGASGGIVARLYAVQDQDLWKIWHNQETYTENNGTVSITGCKNFGAVNGAAKSGGIVGFVDDSLIKTSITYCTNSGDINDSTYAGGIIGYVQSNLDITGSANTGTITALKNNVEENSNWAGLIGYDNPDISHEVTPAKVISGSSENPTV